jgi:ABC-type branched-subunit amino acid transport system permease subunit
VLACLILLEAAALAVGTIYLVVQLFVAKPESFVSAVALAVVAAIATAGLVLIGRGTLRGQPWIRGAAICWQIIQVLVAVSILQAQAPGVAWLLIIPAVAIIVLLFTRPVLAATVRRDR